MQREAGLGARTPNSFAMDSKPLCGPVNFAWDGLASEKSMARPSPGGRQHGSVPWESIKCRVLEFSHTPEMDGIRHGQGEYGVHGE